MRPASLLHLAILFAVTSSSAVAQLTFQSPHPIALHAGDGAASVTLLNPTGAAIPLSLTAGPIVDTVTHAVLPKAKATLSPLAGGTTLPASILPGGTLALQVSVTGVTASSAADLALFNADRSLGTLPLLETDAPMNLAIDGNGTPDKPLDYNFGEPVFLGLKNSDPEPYSIHWELQVDSQLQKAGNLIVPASGTIRIPLKDACESISPLKRLWLGLTAASPSVAPSCKVYNLLDRMHPNEKQGVLLLSVASPADVSASLLPSRTLSVHLLLRRVSPNVSTFLSYVYAGILLFLGGVLSILASSVLPNMQKKVGLRAQLKDLADRTTSVSTRIDSYLRVLLRLERKQIENAIAQISVWLPAATDPLNDISTSIATLDKRLTAAERLDELRRKHEQASSTAPPSVTDDMDTRLQAAADQLHILNLTEPAIGAANTLLNRVQSSLELLEDTDTLAKMVAASLVSLQMRAAKFPEGYADDLKAALPGIFVILDPARGYNDAKNIVRPMLFAIDHAVAAMHLAFDYAMVRASVPAPNVPGCTDAGNLTRQRLLQRHCKLIDLLGTLSWRALQDATLLVQQMREDIYEEDLVAEIAKDGQAALSFDTQKPRPYLPVFFTISFKNQRLNGSAAVQRMVCQWSFPDSLCEFGWKVCHYFSGDEMKPAKPCAECADIDKSQPPPAPAPRVTWWQKHILRVNTYPLLSDIAIHASVYGRKSPLDASPIEIPLKTSIEIKHFVPTERTRFLAEFLRFAIAFAVALAGLLSGALDQLGKLDFIPATIAILALGFGADSIKNLLTQTPRKS